MKVIIDKNFTCDSDMTQEDLDTIIKTLEEMTPEELDFNSTPVDLEKIKEEDSELYKLLTEDVTYERN